MTPKTEGITVELVGGPEDGRRMRMAAMADWEGVRWAHRDATNPQILHVYGGYRETPKAKFARLEYLGTEDGDG